MLTGGLSVARTGLTWSHQVDGQGRAQVPKDGLSPSSIRDLLRMLFWGPIMERPSSCFEGNWAPSVCPSIHPVPQTLPQWPRPRGAPEAVFVFSVLFALFKGLLISSCLLSCLCLQFFLSAS